jgi:uncharacterized membrane protein
MSAAEYARTVESDAFSWTELVARAYAADPTLVRSVRARPELTSSHGASRRTDQVAAIALLVVAPALAALLTLGGTLNADAFGYYAAAAIVLILASIVYVLLGWRKSPDRFRTRRELGMAWWAAAVAVVGAVIAGAASVTGDAPSLNWARPLAGVFLALTVAAVGWTFAVRRRLRAVGDEQPVTTSYAVVGRLDAMDASARAAAAGDLRDALAELDRRSVAVGERPAFIDELAQRP